MATDTGFGKVKFFDDFLGHADDATINWSEGSDTGGTYAITLLDNGVERITSAGTSGNAAAICTALQWEAENGGPLIFEARVKSVTAITDRCYFIGLDDTKHTSTTVVTAFEMSSEALTTNCSNAVGFMYDTNCTYDNWYCCGVKADADATPVNTEVAPAAAGTWQTLRVVVNIEGDATFFIDGKFVGSVEEAVTASTKLQGTILVETRATATKIIDVDYVYIEGGRS